LVIPCCTETRKKINLEPIRTAQKHEVTVANPSRQARPSFFSLPGASRLEGEKERRREREDTLTLITASFLVVVTVSRAYPAPPAVLCSTVYIYKYINVPFVCR
jgi:hypothetical protein